MASPPPVAATTPTVTATTPTVPATTSTATRLFVLADGASTETLLIQNILTAVSTTSFNTVITTGSSTITVPTTLFSWWDVPYPTSAGEYTTLVTIDISSPGSVWASARTISTIYPGDPRLVSALSEYSATYSSSTLSTATKSSQVVPTSQPGNTTSGHHKSKGLTSADDAGIGIGVAVIVAALIFIVYFFCLRRRTRDRASPLEGGSVSGIESYDNHERKSPLLLVGAPHDTLADRVHSSVPQPRADRELIEQFSRLKTRIDNHVHSYYVGSGGDERGSVQALRSALGTNSPIPTTNLAEALANSRSRSSILRAGIAYVVIRRMFPDVTAAQSLLPESIASEYASLSNNKQDDHASRGRWRTAKTASLSDEFGREDIPQDDERTRAIKSAVQEANTFLTPLANKSDEAARLRNLEEIVKRATRFSWTLFSQPSEYSADWTNGGRGIVVFPGLRQIIDDNGTACKPPRDLGKLKEIATT